MLVEVADVSARAGREFSGAELGRVTALITDVTALIESYLCRTYTSPAVVPAVVKAVACLEIQRLLNTDPGVSTERVGDLATGYAYGGALVALSSDAKTMLRPYRARAGLGSIQLLSRYAQPPVEGAP